jgi:hypothetical protein
MNADIDTRGWEARVDRWFVGWFWLVSQDGALRRIGWRPTRRMAERKARAERELLSALRGRRGAC